MSVYGALSTHVPTRSLVLGYPSGSHADNTRILRAVDARTLIFMLGNVVDSMVI